MGCYTLLNVDRDQRSIRASKRVQNSFRCPDEQQPAEQRRQREQ